MSTITINLPSMDASVVLSEFPEIDLAQVVVLSDYSEGTIQLEQAATDWASLVQIQVDDDDILDLADADDIKYKLTGVWPAYSATNAVAITFDDAVFDGSGHETIDGTSGGENVTKLRHALRADMSEDMTGSTQAFDIFSNETDLDTSFGTAADALELAVAANWAFLKGANTEGLVDGVGVLSRETGAAANPGRHILEQILNNNNHLANADIVTALAARVAKTEFINVPLKAGDVINFNITFEAPVRGTNPVGQDLPTNGLSSAAHGARNHIFKVEVTLN